MNPHSKGGHAAAGRKCSIEGCSLPHFGHGWCNSHYKRWRRHGDPTAGHLGQTPATPPPPFPRRIIVADYCRECGLTSGCWQGCAGGERVAAISHTRSPASARITSTENERTPLVAVLGGSGLNGVLEQLGAAHDPGR